ncbi:MAG: 3-hydroxyacyl-CoA dehydrogenase NAD-binding domain-containing protein [Lachnospiraceae bacterium]|nr:3-hydroxyacyl-CoA dehydrogenase NAD-binding domain-containing protein [Lachnospiraceae bacterium]
MKVAVIGAGTMGSGIAQAFAQCADVEKVYLCDIKEEFAEGGKAKIKKQLDKRVAKGKMEQAAADAILGKIVTGLNTIAVDPDLVVEAALENMQIKKDCFKALQDEIVKNPDCIFASNTSSLSITEIGSGLSKPVIGMHFFNPAPVMKLVEVIKGANTPDEVVDKVKEIAVKLGKTPVQVNEAAGFVVNRILVPMINEAICVYAAGVSDIEGIDTAMKLGCNHPMGPLELGDYIGLDIILAIMDVIFAETHDSKYAASPLLRKMVRGKKLGVKTGIGFYSYADGKKVPVDKL